MKERRRRRRKARRPGGVSASRPPTWRRPRRPVGVDRYVADEEWSRISTRTLGGNVHAGFCYDDDDLLMNQMGHPLHGSAYFNAGRTNGFTFWESTLVATLGSLAWEYGFENTAPSRNDMLNTVLGGSVLGETGFRLSRAVLDNTSTGTTRFFRELAGGLVNPVSGVNRLVTGEAWRKGPNPEDRLPDRLDTEVAAGWARSRGTHHADQGFAALALRWGDPFDSPVKKPFDSFDLALRVAAPARTAVTTRPSVASSAPGASARRETAGPPPRHRDALRLPDPRFRVVRGRVVRVRSLLPVPLRKGLEVRTEAQAVVFPIAAFETYCPGRARSAGGRTHDFGWRRAAPRRPPDGGTASTSSASRGPWRGSTRPTASPPRRACSGPGPRGVARRREAHARSGLVVVREVLLLPGGPGRHEDAHPGERLRLLALPVGSPVLEPRARPIGW